MKKILVLVLSILFSYNLHSQIKPKLVVGIVVDQMRYDYIYRFWDKFGENGFKRLINEGHFLETVNLDMSQLILVLDTLQFSQVQLLLFTV